VAAERDADRRAERAGRAAVEVSRKPKRRSENLDPDM
jgi:hypothetical protein